MGNHTGYEMEELVPIVAELAQKYTSFESTSVTYERAEQFMEAVLYCIREAQRRDKGNMLLSSDKLSAYEVYREGYRLVEQNVKRTLRLYNEMMPEFCDYGNRCLYDTFIKVMPEFFKWYDIRFAPQEEILTLDYPVLKDLSESRGVDKVYEYLKCIHMEQRFLGRIKEETVREVLSEYENEYEDMVENLCEILFMYFLRRKSKHEAEVFLREHCEGDEELIQYMTCAAKRASVYQ